MSYEHLIWEQDGGVGRITLNRPETLNAWNPDFGRELKHVIEAEAADPSVRAVLVTGAGRGFSSGADLKAGFDVADDGMPDVAKELNELYHPIVAGVRHLEKPVVAAVNGPAVGIGASLAFACDLILAAESAYFGLAFVNIGLMPDGGSTLFVPTAVGKARAFQMALLGERIEAQRALEWGLVNYVHPDGSLLDEANVLVTRPIMKEPLARLRERCDVTVHENDFGIPRDELLEVVQGRDAIVTMLTEKVDAGARFLITQLFFDNAYYCDFVARAREIGVDVPIIPGIMPITNYGQIKRFTEMCGASIPAELERELNGRADDPEAVAELGVAYATLQCSDLLARGAPGIHFYTLNKSPATRSILAALRAAHPWTRAGATV